VIPGDRHVPRRAFRCRRRVAADLVAELLWAGLLLVGVLGVLIALGWLGW